MSTPISKSDVAQWISQNNYEPLKAFSEEMIRSLGVINTLKDHLVDKEWRVGLIALEIFNVYVSAHIAVQEVHEGLETIFFKSDKKYNWHIRNRSLEILSAMFSRQLKDLENPKKKELLSQFCESFENESNSHIRIKIIRLVKTIFQSLSSSAESSEVVKDVFFSALDDENDKVSIEAVKAISEVGKNLKSDKINSALASLEFAELSKEVQTTILSTINFSSKQGREFLKRQIFKSNYAEVLRKALMQLRMDSQDELSKGESIQLLTELLEQPNRLVYFDLLSEVKENIKNHLDILNGEKNSELKFKITNLFIEALNQKNATTQKMAIEAISGFLNNREKLLESIKKLGFNSFTPEAQIDIINLLDFTKEQELVFFVDNILSYESNGVRLSSLVKLEREAELYLNSTNAALKIVKQLYFIGEGRPNDLKVKAMQIFVKLVNQSNLRQITAKGLLHYAKDRDPLIRRLAVEHLTKTVLQFSKENFNWLTEEIANLSNDSDEVVKSGTLKLKNALPQVSLVNELNGPLYGK